MFESKSKVIVISLVSLATVGFIDYNINYELSTTFIYIVPLFLFSYQRSVGQKTVFAFSLFVCLQWFTIDFLTHPYTQKEFLYWNTLSRVTIFLLVAFVLKRIKITQEQRNLILQQKKEIEAVNKELLKANVELNKFIGMAAHDIRNPVGSIINFSDLLLDDQTINIEQQQFIGYINSCAKNSLQILNDTLQISQIKSGTVELNRQNQDYISFITDCITINNQIAFKKHQRITLITELAELTFCFDENRITQVLNNLLTNAIKYSNFNSSILVNVTCNESKTIIITHVIDHGLGIESNEQSKIFEPFATTSNNPTNNETKTGLGLAISKRIVELHGGTINFESNKNKGSIFYFSLPILNE